MAVIDMMVGIIMRAGEVSINTIKEFIMERALGLNTKQRIAGMASCFLLLATVTLSESADAAVVVVPGATIVTPVPQPFYRGYGYRNNHYYGGAAYGYHGGNYHYNRGAAYRHNGTAYRHGGGVNRNGGVNRRGRR